MQPLFSSFYIFLFRSCSHLPNRPCLTPSHSVLCFCFSFQSPPFLFRFIHMSARRNRMVEYHTRTRKSHNLSDFLPHLGPITMHLAVGAKCFRFHERTQITSSSGVFIQFLTGFTQSLFGVMALLAVQRNHLRNKLFLSISLINYRFRSHILVPLLHFIFIFILSRKKPKHLDSIKVFRLVRVLRFELKAS